MIFESEEQIYKTIEEPKNGELLDYARKQSALLYMYVTGKGLKNNITKLPFFLKEDQEEVRKDVTRTTVDLIERLLHPVSKVFTAKGGVRAYNLPESKSKELEIQLSNVKKGLSIKQWVGSVAWKAYLVDPMSLMYTEVNNEGEAYPTYKSTLDIHDYDIDGRNPEYVIFKLTKAEIETLRAYGVIRGKESKEVKYYRVVDDAYSRIIAYKGDGKGVILLETENFFGRVPAKISSNIPSFDSMYYSSPLEPSIELVEDYFNDNSSKSLFKKYQMHVKEWGILVDCRRCDGTGSLEGNDCHKCDGTGRTISRTVADKVGITTNSDGSTTVPTPPFGFVAPPVESWTMSNQEIDKLEQNINGTFWGDNRVRKMEGIDSSQNSLYTATGEVMQERAKEPKLKEISKWAQDIDKFHTDNIKRVMLINPNASDSTIVYGDKYVLAKPEELLIIYNDAKEKKLAKPILDDLLIEYYESKYETNRNELESKKKTMYVEPYVHNTIDEVMAIGVDEQTVNMKKVFPEWLNTVTTEQLIIATEEELRASLIEYSTNLITIKTKENGNS